MGFLILVCLIGTIVLAVWYHTRLLEADARKRPALSILEDAQEGSER